MVKTNQLGKFGHILCILGVFWAINGHSRGSTSHHLSDLIFMFLESVDLGGWGQLDSQFKNDIFGFLPPPNVYSVAIKHEGRPRSCLPNLKAQSFHDSEPVSFPPGLFYINSSYFRFFPSKRFLIF